MNNRTFGFAAIAVFLISWSLLLHPLSYIDSGGGSFFTTFLVVAAEFLMIVVGLISIMRRWPAITSTVWLGTGLSILLVVAYLFVFLGLPLLSSKSDTLAEGIFLVLIPIGYFLGPALLLLGLIIDLARGN